MVERLAKSAEELEWEPVAWKDVHVGDRVKFYHTKIGAPGSASGKVFEKTKDIITLEMGDATDSNPHPTQSFHKTQHDVHDIHRYRYNNPHGK